MKIRSARSGRSKSEEFPHGVRRSDSKGRKLAPKSLRRKGFDFIENCPEDALKNLGMEA